MPLKFQKKKTVFQVPFTASLLLVLLFSLLSSDAAFVDAFTTRSHNLMPSTRSSTVHLRRNMAHAASKTECVILLPHLSYRSPTPEDIPRCFEIESASYPADEAATLEGLKYRQANAGDYFQLCTIHEDSEETIVGFVCSTRCHDFTEESMSTHHHDGKLLAIHSVVVEEPFRRRGIAKTMLQHYVKHIKEQQQLPPTDRKSPISSMVLLAKAHLLGFYVQCGFHVNRPSPIVHGQELWYELEQSCSDIRSLPNDDESWFCKTEQFKRPFPEVKPYLEEHKLWVEQLRRKGYCITSGYRVDAEGKPGGGGLMFLAAKSFQDALEIVKQDPLVANDCVEWELNGWIGQVGDVQMR